MTDTITSGKAELGMIGLGVMGRNLLLNLADHGFRVAGYDRSAAQVAALAEEGRGQAILAATDLTGLVAGLKIPRTVMLLVPAGAAVDAVIHELVAWLEPGDLIIDAGNSHFKDTETRAKALAIRGIHFLGVGISGGESGARHGPSLMPGGDREVYERVRPMLEAVAAKVKGEPCVTWLGPGAVGHYVKMVHNGIEYAVMQLLAESYDLMKRGYGLTDDELGAAYRGWNAGELNGYLMEITGNIFERPDGADGGRLIDAIMGVARQNGTGMWTSQSAMELQVPTPTIDVAVAMRNVSLLTAERELAGVIYRQPEHVFNFKRDLLLEQVGRALFAGILVSYAQGMALLSVASKYYGYGLNLGAVARIWRGGCIIRSALLDNIAEAYATNPELGNILLAPNLSQQLADHLEGLRQTIWQAAAAGVPVPGLMVSLGYFDAYRSAWLPDNLIQAQRDYFGAHTYERIEGPGSFHTDWEKTAVEMAPIEKVTTV